MTTALTTTDYDPIERWDAAVSRYLETRKGGLKGNTAKTYERTLRDYKSFALESGLNPWAGDAIISATQGIERLCSCILTKPTAKLRSAGQLQPDRRPAPARRHGRKSRDRQL
jgi:hypothetical protein